MFPFYICYFVVIPEIQGFLAGKMTPEKQSCFALNDKMKPHAGNDPLGMRTSNCMFMHSMQSSLSLMRKYLISEQGSPKR